MISFLTTRKNKAAFGWILIVCVIALIEGVVSNKQTSSSSSRECDSFYDYVCDLEDTISGTKSYFEMLRDQHSKTTTTILTSMDLYDKCMEIMEEPSLLKRLISSSSSSSTLSYQHEKSFIHGETGGKRYVSMGNSFYSVLWTVESIKRNGFGVDFPVKVEVTKKLDSTETCLDVSPNIKWLNSAYDATTSEPFKKLSDESVKKPLSDFVYRLKETFEKTTMAMLEKENSGQASEIIDYLNRYTTISKYESSMRTTTTTTTTTTHGGIESPSSTKNQFWKDVLMNLYGTKDGSLCLHTNGYEKYYSIVEKYVTFPIVNVNFLEALTAFSEDVKFGKFSTSSGAGTSFDEEDGIPYGEKITRCEKIVRKAIPRSVNDAFLKMSGSADAFEKDVSVENMLNALKKAINETVFESTHLPMEFKRFASKKIGALKSFVMNKLSPSGIDVEVEETACLNIEKDMEKEDGEGGRRVTWFDIMECLATRKMNIERDIVYKASKSENHEYGRMTFDERYEYLYENTDLSIVNAWYDPTKNEITIPAGIVFWPMYSGSAFSANDMHDYSRMGMILAHELGHALDSNGLCWDERGNYDVSNRYCSKSKLPPLIKQNMDCLMNEYGHPCGTDDKYGERTLGEDMADQLGLTASWRIFKEQYGAVLRVEDEREFFRKYAQLWCEGKHPQVEEMRSIKTLSLEDASTQKNEYKDGVGKKSNLPFALERIKIAKHYKASSTTDIKNQMTDEKWICDRVMNDVHALPKHRVNKSLRQLKSFSDTFGCKLNDNMYKETPCVIY